MKNLVAALNSSGDWIEEQSMGIPPEVGVFGYRHLFRQENAIKNNTLRESKMRPPTAEVVPVVTVFRP